MTSYLKDTSQLCRKVKTKALYLYFDTVVSSSLILYYIVINIYIYICIYIKLLILISIQFSCSVMSDSLPPHGLQDTRLPWPSPTPRAYSNPCPSSWWCHPTISSSVVPFSSCLQSCPASESFLMSRFFTVAKVLALQLQHQSFQWIFRTDFL